MPLCHCQFAHCNGADVSVTAFNKHKREDKIAYFQNAVDLTQEICRRQDEAIATHLTTAPPNHQPKEERARSRSSPRVKSYQHMINSRLHQLSDIEKRVDSLVASAELKLLSLGVPQNRDDEFPLSSSIASVRTMFHKLSGVSSRSPSVQETKAPINDRLSSLMRVLREAKKHWKEAQDKFPPCSKSLPPRGFYDTEMHSTPILAKVDPIIQATVFTMVVLQVVMHLSRRGCHFLLAMVSYIVHLALLRNGHVLSIQDQKLLADFPKDPDTAMKQFLLDGHQTIYAVCPKASCQKLHAPCSSGFLPILEYPKYCSHSECGTRLTRPRFFGDIKVEVPIKRFVAFSFKDYVASLTSRPGFEDYMDNVSASVAEGAEMRDVFDGEFLRNFEGPDKKPFRSTSGPEGRYSFSLGFDFFNPFTNKQAGKKVSAGIISVVCLNLPIPLRYKPENMFLAGIIPGPNEPPLTTTNHYLAPIIDEFVEFWEPGVHFSQTAKFPSGRLILCALVLVVCDLPAARKISGFAACTSEHFCNICHCRLSKPGLQNTDYSNWKMRTDKEYREAMGEYKEASTDSSREDKFKQHGIRCSELERLSYFNMVDCVVVDPAHNHFLGLINEHFTNILGIRLKVFQEDPVIELDFDQVPTNLSENTVKGVDRIKSWLRSPYSITFGPTREGGMKKLMRVNADALEFVCGQIQCPLPILPENRERHTKQEYCDSILSWREEQDEVREPGAANSTLCGHVLQADEMAHIWSDLEQMLTPSWMTSVPSKLGQPAHGKLKADQWRVLGTTHLAISLIRLWGMASENNERSRKCYEILRVTLSLISAIILATSHSVTIANADAYLSHMLEYLEGIKRLFPGYKLKPNHHMALHVHRYLRLFGPMHSWWTFPFERIIGSLQRMPNNGKLGEVEETIAHAYTRLGNIRRLLSKAGCPEVIQHSRPFFEELFYTQQREKLQVLVRPEMQSDLANEYDRGTQRPLPPDLRYALLRANVEVPLRAHLPSYISINGLRFTTSTKHPGNSCVMIILPNFPEPVPAQLVYIVRFQSCVRRTQTYLGVRRHRVADINRDPYLCFPILRAQIWDAGLGEIEIISPLQVACHFACLPVKFEGKELVIAMSLSRTIVLQDYEELNTDE